MLWRVARATGRSLKKVARAPYHRTLYEFVQLQEQERIEGIVDRFRNLQLASLTGVAFNEPKLLKSFYDETANSVVPKTTREEAIERAADVIAHMQRRAMKQMTAPAEHMETPGGSDGR